MSAGRAVPAQVLAGTAGRLRNMKKAPAATAGARRFTARNRSHGDRIGLRKHITLSGVGSSERAERLPARRGIAYQVRLYEHRTAGGFRLSACPVN